MLNCRISVKFSQMNGDLNSVQGASIQVALLNRVDSFFKKIGTILNSLGAPSVSVYECFESERNQISSFFFFLYPN